MFSLESTLKFYWGSKAGRGEKKYIDVQKIKKKGVLGYSSLATC